MDNDSLAPTMADKGNGAADVPVQKEFYQACRSGDCEKVSFICAL